MPTPFHRRSLTIRQKQTVTLAGAIGILACGACFVPSHYTPPPPPPIVTEGVKNVRIVVIDESEPKRINLPALEGVILAGFDRFPVHNKITAYPEEKAAPEVDAILEIRILSLTTIPDPSPTAATQQKWGFNIRTTATLSRRNGDVIWRGGSIGVPHFDSYARDEESMWKDPIIQSELVKSVGNRLYAQAVYQFPKSTLSQEPPAPAKP
jgi:hypothetical protein